MCPCCFLSTFTGDIMKLLYLILLKLIPQGLFCWCMLVGSVGMAECQSPETITVGDCLIVGPISEYGRFRRCAIHEDPIEARIIAGDWSAPQEGDTVEVNNGSARAWIKAVAGQDRWLEHSALRGGYVYMPVESECEQVVMMEAAAHSMFYVNDVPRVGHTYGYYNCGQHGEADKFPIPILLRQGKNDLLFACWNKRMKMPIFFTPKADAVLNVRDRSMPDLIVAEPTDTWAAVVVINATTTPMKNLYIQASSSHTETTLTPLPQIPAAGLRKVGFRLQGQAPSSASEDELKLELVSEIDGKTQILDTATIPLHIRMPDAKHQRTFISEIDGSVQHYAIVPAQPLEGQLNRPLALVFSTHGAGVDSWWLADAYEHKSWCHIVVPMNRRPFGFDWEEWGRMDALEALEDAQRRLQIDPQRIYITGHSMGGHGAWYLSATYPDKFAAIAPSAGWVSMWSYARALKFETPTPVEQILRRSQSASDVLGLAHNYANKGIYIIHGGNDDDVPVSESHMMIDKLNSFHKDFVYHEEPNAIHWWDHSDDPGVDCVDWPDLFDFLARHRNPEIEAVRQVDFITANPGVSAWSYWAGIEAQIKQLQLSSVNISYNPSTRYFKGTTDNVARLALSLGHIRHGQPVSIELDGQQIKDVAWPGEYNKIWLERDKEQWSVITKPVLSLKGPHRYGLFKDAFRNRMLFVYGTQGNEQENAWSLAKACYDAESFWYRGNGSIDIVSDIAFDDQAEPDRNIVLYGNADTNAAWNKLLAESPVQAHNDAIRIGKRELNGNDLACLFIRPRPGSDIACVGVVGGSGVVGMRMIDRLPYFVSGVGYPDCIVISSEILNKSSVGVLSAGFFGLDWGVDSGEFAWRD